MKVNFTPNNTVSKISKKMADMPTRLAVTENAVPKDLYTFSQAKFKPDAKRDKFVAKMFRQFYVNDLKNAVLEQLFVKFLKKK